MSTFKNPTFTFDLTQIQVVSFQCNQFFIKNHKDIKYGLKIILKYVDIEVYGEFFSGITPFRQKRRNAILMVPCSSWL
jgi:hypothetical protein